MLELQMGLNRDVRRARLMNEIKKRIDETVSRIYVLVPEQSTFTMEREVCRILGNDISNQYVTVVGFDRLSRLAHEASGTSATYMDEGGRLLAMAMAAAESKKSLSILKDSATRPEFLETLVRTYTAFKTHEVSIPDLNTLSDGLGEEAPSLAKKLQDISTIYERYEEICKDGTLDPTEAMTGLADILAVGDWLNGTAWFIDGFTDFPKQQLGIIRQIIRKSVYTMASFASAGLDDMKPGHAIASATAKKLVELANEGGIDCELVHTDSRSTEHPALAYLQENLCDNTVAKESSIESAGKVIKLFCDSSVHQECQHIVATMMKAVRKGYRYRDISVILCDYERYAPTMQLLCHRYDIPVHFSSQKDEIGKSPVMLSVFSALNAATRGMSTEDVLQYLKSGLCNLEPEEVDALEEYIRMWRIHGRGFQPGASGWIMHPNGHGVEFKEADAERLAEINRIRVKGVDPLLALKRSLGESTTVEEYVLATYDFLESISFTEKLQQLVDDLVDAGQDQLAAEYAQISGVLNSAMEQMHGVLGRLEKPTRDYVKLFKLLCSSYKIATIPGHVDQVEIFAMGDARYTCSKIRYIAGAEEGFFPEFAQTTSLLDSDEIDLLKSHDVYLPGSVEEKTNQSLAEIDTVISGAKKMLVLSYASDPLAPATPSHLLRRVQKMFPDIPEEAGVGEDGISPADLMHPVAAGRLMGRLLYKPRYDDIVYTLAAVDNTETQEVCDRMLDKASWALGDLSKASIRGLYGENIPLSATRLDTYSACRYHHFLKYSLGLRVPACGKLDSPVFGRFAHYVLEKTTKAVESEYGGFKHISVEELESLTRKHIEEYKDKFLKGLSDQPERFIYLYKRNCREIMSILTNQLHEEMNQSDFKITGTELKVGGESADLPAIRIVGKDSKGTFTGIIDRVDVCDVNGDNYFRVVDYKTGKTKLFDMTDILCGMSMQLILYQSALRKRMLDESGSPAEQAGIMYIPAKDVIVATSTKPDEEKVESERQKMQVRHGIILDNKEVLQAMEHVAEGSAKFLPIKYHADGHVSGEVASAEQLEMLNSYAELVMQDAVDGIAGGNIQANPISRGKDRTSCTYCPMKGACHKDSCGTGYRYRAQVTSNEFWAAIEKKTGEV